MNQYEIGIQRFIEKLRKQIKLKEQEYLQIEKSLIHKIVHKSPQPARTLELRPNNFLDVSAKPKHLKPKSNPNHLKTQEEFEPEILPYLLRPLNNSIIQNQNRKISLRIPTVIPASQQKIEKIELKKKKPLSRNQTPRQWTVESSDDAQV